MREVSLTRGLVAIVDDEDYELVSKHKWCASPGPYTYYAMRKFKVEGKYTHVFMHRLIIGARNGAMVDHINGNGLDNRKCNLRLCTKGQNRSNSRPNKNTTCGYKGVVKKKGLTNYEAQITHDGKTKYLGSFRDIEDAAKAYNIAAIEYFGEFAKLNILKEA